jgi:hypothetical protein
MKKFLLSVMSVFAVLMLAGCQQAPSTTTNQDEVALVESEEEQLSFIGSWTRVGMVLNGSPMENKPAVLTLNSDHTYTSVGTTCSASGKYDISTEGEDTITMSHLSTNCPNPPTGPVTFQYSISEDGNTMVNTTGPLVETYMKNS